MRAGRVAVMLAMATLVAGCGAQQSSTLPEELVGVWRTPTPPYADRYFELQPRAISFGTGGGSAPTHVIDSVEMTRQGHQTLYTVTYRDGGQRYRWSFLYDPAGKSIRFTNRIAIVWTKGQKNDR